MLGKLFFVTISGLLAVSAQDTTVYLEDKCNALVNLEVEDSITIRLKRDGDFSPPSCRTVLTLRPKGNARLLAAVSAFDLTAAGDGKFCLRHFLKLDGLEGTTHNDIAEQRLCGGPDIKTLGRYLFSNETENTLYYSRSVPFERNDSVTITVSTVAFADADGTCLLPNRTPEGEGNFKCESDSLCIPRVLKCDEQANCKDESDERDCIGTITTEPAAPSVSTVASLSPFKEIARDDRASGSSKRPQIIIGALGGVVILALVAIIALFLVRRSKRRYRTVTTTNVPESASRHDDIEEINTALKQPEDSSV
ncbi:uncharacterized protein LOC100901068 [Galendromus occidentalis]|uniref:Uncharacterized protein LOC100901068 n=1 Tax=Galendromus occidentalis TaxID=34638 RepID=A0AAJ6QSU5_9ACAR|nr:uncharacterized protein LOC100901068 [Galendromus occidentalis]